MVSADNPAPGSENEPAPEAGVLGNLPRSRPSVRSPNRPDPPPEMRAETGESEAPAGHSGAAQSAVGELESLARAGASVAGGVAGLGLRVAGRAAAALRDAAERR